MPFVQLATSSWAWYCPLCRTKTPDGALVRNQCCLDTFRDDQRAVYKKTPKAGGAKTRMLGNIIATSITKRISDHRADEHRPYHERLGLHGEETNAAPQFSGQRTSNEGSRGSAPPTGRGPEAHPETPGQESEGGAAPAVAETPVATIVCPACDGNGFKDGNGFLVNPPPCSPCGGSGRVTTTGRRSSESEIQRVPVPGASSVTPPAKIIDIDLADVERRTVEHYLRDSTD